MDLAVDHAGQHMQARCVEDLASLPRIKRTYSSNLSAAHRDIADRHAAGRGDSAAFQDQIECRGHQSAPETWRCMDLPGGFSKQRSGEPESEGRPDRQTRAAL